MSDKDKKLKKIAIILGVVLAALQIVSTILDIINKLI